MRLITIALFAAVAAPALFAQDLQTVNVEETLTMDGIGDGVMNLKMTLNGEQFQNWQSKYGTNQSLLKRDMQAYVSQYETSDWKMEVNQMDRIVNVSCHFKGALIHRGGGLFEFRVPKTWRGGERHESVYTFNFVEPGGNGGVVQTNAKLILPAAASSFSDDKSETGDRVIRYHLPVGGAGRWLFWLGVAALLIGAAATAYAFLGMRDKPAAAAAAHA